MALDLKSEGWVEPTTQVCAESGKGKVGSATESDTRGKESHTIFRTCC